MSMRNWISRAVAAVRSAPEWPVVLGAVLAVGTLVWWKWDQRPVLRVEHGIYEAVAEVASASMSSIAVIGYADLQQRCRIARLQWNVPSGIRPQIPNERIVVIPFLLHNSGKSDAVDVALSIPMSLRTLGPPSIASTPNIRALPAVETPAGFQINVDRLAANSSAVVTAKWLLPSSAVGGWLADGATIGWLTVSAQGVRERTLPPARDALGILLVQEGLQQGLFDDFEVNLQAEAPGAYEVSLDLVEYAAEPSLSYSGTCGYTGPDRAMALGTPVRRFARTVVVDEEHALP